MTTWYLIIIGKDIIFSEGLHPSKIGNDYSCPDTIALIISFLKMPFGACMQHWQRWKEKENVFLATCKVQLALRYPLCSKMHIPGWSSWVAASRVGARSQQGHGGHVSPTLYEPRIGEPTDSWVFFLEPRAKYFYYSLRNQWVGTDGKWEAAKGKKTVLEWSAEPARLSRRVLADPDGTILCAVSAWHRRLSRPRSAPYPLPAESNGDWDPAAPFCLFPINPRATAQHVAYRVLYAHETFKKNNHFKNKQKKEGEAVL